MKTFNHRKRVTAPSPARPGIVMVLVLLGVVLLAALVVYVLNLGQQVNRKVETQNAADTAAAAGAGWVARSMNMVAGDNTGIAQLIAAVDVVDSVPLAVDFSYKADNEILLGDESALYLAAVHELNQNIVDPIWRTELTKARDRIGPPVNPQPTVEEGMLKHLDELFKTQPQIITDMTFHDPAAAGHATSVSGPGHFWRAMYAMDQFSQAAMENLSTLAQTAAIDAGRANMTGTDRSAFIAPVVPQIPWKRGTFNDFQRPVRNGLLPVGVDDKINNRGPFDAVFGWRWTNSHGGGDFRSDPPGWSPPTEGTRYHVYGPQEFLLRNIGDVLIYGRFNRHLRNVAGIKLSYIWPTKRNEADPNSLKYIVDPDWETDVENDNERSTYPMSGYESGDPDDLRQHRKLPTQTMIDYDPVPRTVYDFATQRSVDMSDSTPYVRYVSGTLFLVLDLYSSLPNDPFNESTKFRAPGVTNPTWYIDDGTARSNRNGTARSFYASRWVDPQRDPFHLRYPRRPTTYYPGTGQEIVVPTYNSTWVQLHSGRWAWKQTMTYQTNPEVEFGQYAHGAYPQIGLQPIQTGVIQVQIGVDTNGQPIYTQQATYASQPYYRTRFFLLVGVNVGPERVVRDPFTGFNPFAADAPAPIDLDHSALPVASTDARRQYLTYLAIARQADTAFTWPSRFRSYKPLPTVASLAQAQVFNNHSFDMWTQMWETRLETVSDYNGWLGVLATPVQTPAAISADEQTAVYQYLKAVQPLADLVNNP